MCRMVHHRTGTSMEGVAQGMVGGEERRRDHHPVRGQSRVQCSSRLLVSEIASTLRVYSHTHQSWHCLQINKRVEPD